MTPDGYPDYQELELIKTWDVNDFPALLDFIEERHSYPTYVEREPGKDWHKNPILIWHYSTAGWSGNESMIYALLENLAFRSMWYYSWQRGGHYVFHIDPRQAGFELVRYYCERNKITRKAVSKSPHLYDRFVLTPNKIFIRKKTGQRH